MSPNGISPGFNDVFIISSSDSSDSESLLQEDIKSSESQISKQWEAIERTLYQEPGQQVTDTELLKECKLWRETFPHFRVKGTKIDINQAENETDKNVQTLKNHFNLKKLEEKRENIKTKVVGMLVERLITKYRPGKESANSEVSPKNGGVQITEIDDDCCEHLSHPSPTNKPVKSSAIFNTDKESYFERGKLPNGGIDERTENMEEIFESWKRDTKTAKKLPKTYLKNDFKKLDSSYGVNFSDKPIKERLKPKKLPTSPPALGNITKPFEMTKKIDKKYEGLVDKIFERKTNELETIRHCRTSASGFEMRNFQESLEKLRIGSGFDDYIKRNTKPRLNKFDNNWLKRREMNYTDNGFSTKKSANVTAGNSFKNLNLYSEDSQDEVDDKFIEDLKREVALNYKRPPKRSGVIEEISLRRPKPMKPAVEKAPKSFSCGDLSSRNEVKSKQVKSTMEMGKKESNLKKSVKHNHLNNRVNKSNGIKSQILPPIESGIICTELTGRPKVGAKIPPKRY